MTDTITESFCERCGTRYSFGQIAKPRRVGIGRVRVLTRGVKNFIANDGMPMNEAMAVARNDEERAGASRQLDAFHRTFKFCMSCRQYTCANCWNEKAGECLTCAPDLTREVLPELFPDLPLGGPADAADLLRDSEVVAAAAWPTADLARTTTDPATAPPMDAAALPEIAEPLEEPGILARPETLVAGPTGHEVEELTSAERAEIEGALAASHPALEPPAEPGAEPEPSLLAVEPPTETAEAAQTPEPAAAVEFATGAEPQAGGEPLVATTADHAAATARRQTRSLLGRFRPFRRHDAAAVATPAAVDERPTTAERSIAPLAAAEPAAEPAPEPTAEPEMATVQAEAAVTEPAPVPEPTAEPEMATVQAAAEPAAEPAPEPEVAPEPAPADTIEQPTWRMVAPDVSAAPRPDWPDAPAWPSPAPGATPAAGHGPGPAAAPWASRLATARPEPAGVWAASSQEVLTTPGPSAARGPGPAVQACVSCGLSLSANARFCRRCGTRQA